MGAKETSGARPVLERLQQAMHDHNLVHFLADFREDYRSEQPAHPERAFGGRAQVEENWAAMFRELPDFHAELLRSVVAGDTVWAEWAWHGTRRDHSQLEMRGVTLFGVRDGLIAWGRLYMELVTSDDDNIREATQQVTTGPRRERR